MIVALPVCTKDEHLAVLGLRVARKLDASVPFECVIVHERGHDVSAIVGLAKGYFKDVGTLMYEPCPYGTEFPKPHNWAWQHTARFMLTQTKPWLWWEPDACPCRTGWLTTLANAYKEGRKPFAGPIERGNRRPYLVGVAIYPHNAAVRCENAMITRQGPFDQVLSWLDNAVGQSLDIGHLLYHDFRADGSGKHWRTLKELPAEAVLWHRCKTGQLHRLLLGEESLLVPIQTTIAAHSGDRGDVVYGLAVCLAKGYRHLQLFPVNFTRERMTPTTAHSIATLALAQPYIDTCEFVAEPEADAVILSGFRNLMSADRHGLYLGHNLSALHLRWAGLPEGLETEQWLWVTPLQPPKPVIFARSARYHSETLDWKRCYHYYRNRSVFVGLPDEHKAFCKEVGNVPYLPTSNLHELARYIRGSELFIGNQSCPYAIAEGMKHPAILEWVPGPSQNTHFSRRNLWYGTEGYELPAIKPKSTVDWHVLTDLHSGLGQVGYQYYLHCNKFKLNWRPTRISKEFCPLDDGIELAQPAKNDLRFMLEAVPHIREFHQTGDVTYSMWESTQLPKSAVRAINDGPMGIVPSQWCRQVYHASGVVVPLMTVPLGVDSTRFVPDPAYAQKDVLTFGASGRFCGDGNPRKNLDKVIAGFLAAFPTQKDVRLVVKGYDSNTQLTCSDPRVSIVCEFWPTSRLVKWYQGLDAFINLAAGGGWELHVQEAMCCGAVPVVINWSSTLEFVDPFCGYMVNPVLVDANWGPYAGQGKWALPDMNSYVATLQQIYEQRDELQKRRVRARDAAAPLTWAAATQKLEHCLSKLL